MEGGGVQCSHGLGGVGGSGTKNRDNTVQFAEKSKVILCLCFSLNRTSIFSLTAEQ